jgi:Limiting CO2-inducible proteins B/C beta carbonyic anhydrases
MTKRSAQQLGEAIPQTLNAQDPNVFPAFHETLNTYFPGAVPMNKYMRKTFQSLSAYDFSDENTMSMIAVCRDEIAEALFIEVIRYWGKTFNCCSLAGFVMMGKTGLAAATDHTPIVDGIRRFTFYAMPHVAISRYGEIGKVYRDGVNKVSHACGALETVVDELACGHLKLEMDMQDIEQTIIRQKILSTITYGDKPNLIEVTKLASRIISNDVENLLNTLDRKVFKYAVMTGIQIHGPLGSHWIYPQDFYVVGSDLPGGKESIEVFKKQNSKAISN